MRVKLVVTDTQEHELVVAAKVKRCKICYGNINPGDIYVGIWHKPEQKYLEASKEGDEEAKRIVAQSFIGRRAVCFQCYGDSFGIPVNTEEKLVERFKYELEHTTNKAVIERTATILAIIEGVKSKMLRDEVPKDVSQEITKAILSDRLKKAMG